MTTTDRGQDLFLREASEADMMLYFDWANDPVVRQNSFQTEPISLETHEKWFQKKRKEETCLMYVLTDGKTDYGQVRGQIGEGKIEIGYSIGKEYRGKGLAKLMLGLFEEKCLDIASGADASKEDVRKSVAKAELYAEVKKENPVSGKVFEHLGYQKTEAGDILVFVKPVLTGKGSSKDGSGREENYV